MDDEHFPNPTYCPQCGEMWEDHMTCPECGLCDECECLLPSERAWLEARGCGRPTALTPGPVQHCGDPGVPLCPICRYQTTRM